MQRAELHVRGLNAEVVNAFRECVLKKYGKLHTVFGLEVEKALSEYLKKRE
jgi:ribosome-associated translation inhibitor RaiA